MINRKWKLAGVNTIILRFAPTAMTTNISYLLVKYNFSVLTSELS